MKKTTSNGTMPAGMTGGLMVMRRGSPSGKPLLFTKAVLNIVMFSAH